MAESETQPKRVPLFRKPTRPLELMRVMGDKWEYEDSAGGRYLELRTDHGDEWFLLALRKLDPPSKPAKPQYKMKPCCKQLRHAWRDFIDFGKEGRPSRNGAVTILDKCGQHTKAIHYCPFCGSEKTAGVSYQHEFLSHAQACCRL